ncbi:acetyltransferase [Citrobacter freundii]|nr:acetyltransferase [Citrobacter freundii]
MITGYASFGDWRNFDGFRHTVEHSVYVHPENQGKGVGRALLCRLIEEARACGKHVMVAALSLRIRRRCICTARWVLKTTAQMPQVGTKFGRWLDLTFMQLQLDERREPDASR